MKKIKKKCNKDFEKLTIAEVEAISNFCDQIGDLMATIDEARMHINRKDRRRYDKTYKNLGYFWEQFQDRLIYLWDADERNKDN